MTGDDELAGRFEEHREHLRGVAYRMLGSAAEADDAVQETWLRLGRVDAREIGNLAGWLTTVVSRVCLDMLRLRTARREDPLGDRAFGEPAEVGDPEREALFAESVGRALLVVLDALAPAERVAFVLHDLFAVPFDRIAPVVGRTPVTTKKLASRARHKVRGVPAPSGVETARRRVVEAFLAAAREGDMEALLAVLDPEVVRRADPAALPSGVPAVSRGARTVAGEVLVLGGRARFAEIVLVNGSVGAVVAPYGRLLLALTFTVENDRITEYEVIADPVRLRDLTLSFTES
ncbi:sigma-70 family RNA polymerase sigma factor [Streptosporangium saharense]|uniref:sigma-70 family RNA polymerase sigma factor n=1 Tax=Streptosporangium saharense TaxID=1706840 RepID=UPI0034296990